MALIRPQQFYAAKLTRPLDLAGSETEVYVSSLPTETTGSLVINPRARTRREKITYTGTSSSGGNHLTGVTRGVPFATTTGTVTSTSRVEANCLRHAVGESVEMVSGHYESLMSDILNGIGTMVNDINMGGFQFTNVGTPTLNGHVATKEYADNISTGGGPDANLTTKGFTEVATTAEIDADTQLGTTGAFLSVSPDQLVLSKYGIRLPSASQKTLLNNITASAAEINTLNGFTGSTSNLNESATFFANTDMTASEAETLTNGSSANALHHHVQSEVTVLPSAAYEGDTAGVFYDTGSGGVYMNFADAVNDNGYFPVVVPQGATTLTGVTVNYDRSATGNLYLRFYFVKNVQGGTTTTDQTDTYTTYAATTQAGETGNITVPSAAFDNIAACSGGNIIAVHISRDASHASDTFNAVWAVTGVKFTFS